MKRETAYCDICGVEKPVDYSSGAYHGRFEADGKKWRIQVAEFGAHYRECYHPYDICGDCLRKILGYVKRLKGARE